MILFLFAIMMLNLGKDSKRISTDDAKIVDISCYPMYCTISRIDFCISKCAISRRRIYKNDRCSRSV
jgi:hypothetical protein